jgi:hypothetical protein
VTLGTIPGTAGPNYTAHTLGSTNNVANGQLPFAVTPATPSSPSQPYYQWLVHLDRKPISPIELLQVSLYQPHQLTQNFITGDDSQAGKVFQHTGLSQRLEWFNPANRIYRLFEFLQIRPGTGWNATTPGGRVLGQMNINTIWDLETFLALCDPLPLTPPYTQWSNTYPHYYTTQDVINIYNTLFTNATTGRTPGMSNPTNPTVGSVDFSGANNDRPFLSLATGPTAGTANTPRLIDRGIDDTLFRRSTTNNLPLLMQIPLTNLPGQQPQPYLQGQLLSKIFNNVTTRSNTFAVFLTVGFFEVLDDSTRPVKLGAEIGKDQNRQIRHRMFAIIDRTRLQTIFPLSTTNPITSQSTINAGQLQTVSPVTQQPAGSGTYVAALSGTTSQGHNWQFLPGMQLIVQSTTAAGTTQRERVVVRSVDTTRNTFTADFTLTHTTNIQITAQGHPGPQVLTPFNPHNSPLIAHFSIID